VCIRCNSTKHKAQDCPFKDKECFGCGKVGHTQRACLSKGSTPAKPKFKSKVAKTVEYEAELELDIELLQINAVSKDKRLSDKVYRKVSINGSRIKFEVDTGSAITLINERKYKKYLPATPLQNCATKLSGYGGHKIPVLGQLRVKVNIGKQQTKMLRSIVVSGPGACLIGRDWLQHVDGWKHVIGTTEEIKSINSDTGTENEIRNMLQSEYPNVFKEGLGHLRGTQATLDISDDAKPVFCKARTVPFSLRGKVDHEIERLQKEGILEPVTNAAWAAPTVNRYAKNEQYPMPKMDELLANLQGGQEFTKLDLRTAYHQVELDEKSRVLTTINTTKGLFQYTRVPYGVSTAPTLFQRIMENLLKDIPGVSVAMDDIAVTGKNQSEHMRNLREVLRRLEEAGLRLKLEKCRFFMPSIDYMGVVIDCKGIHPISSKVKAVKDAPAPTNIPELRSYLGLLNHYRKFLPDLATQLAPLYKLLAKGEKWVWTDRHHDAFERSKEGLTSDTLLVHYDPDKPLLLSCDASPYG
jgi:hypothetical protein